MAESIRDRVSVDDQLHGFNLEQMSRVIELIPVNNQPCQANDASQARRPNSEISDPFRSSQSGPNMGRSLGQILIILVVLLVNIPFNSYSAGLAQLMPQSNSIVIRDGLLLKGSGPEIYVVDNYKLRLISPEALSVFFSHYRHINTVEDSLLAQFGQGPPVHRLLQCRTKPDIYAVEDGHKRRVTDPPATNNTKPWDRVYFVSCSYLSGLPDGLPIPEDATRWTSY
jgi:hypothetical protein